MLFGERLAAGGLRARHDQRGRLQPILDAETGDAERCAADQDDERADQRPAMLRLSPKPSHGNPSLGCLRGPRTRRHSGAVAEALSGGVRW